MTHTNELYTKIAADFANVLWLGLGKAIAHGSLAYTAGAAIDKTDPQDPGFLSWINPLPKTKKLLTFLALEAATYPGQNFYNNNWNKPAPIVEKFLTPVIETIITPELNFLQDKGYITLQKVAETVVAPETITIATETAKTVIEETVKAVEPQGLFSRILSLPSTLASMLTLPGASAAPIPTPEVIKEVIKETIQPEKIIEPAKEGLARAYETADQYAPRLGGALAELLEGTADYGTRMLRMPGNLVSSVSAATGLPQYIVAPAMIGVGMLAYYGVKAGYNSLQQTVVQGQTTTVNTSTNANATGNTIHVHVTGTTQPQVQPQQPNGVTIVTTPPVTAINP